MYSSLFLILLLFGSNLLKKSNFGLKQKKMNVIIKFNTFKLVLAKNSSLNRHIWFLDLICLKRVFPVWHRKIEHHRRIYHTKVRVGTKYYLKQDIISKPYLPKNDISGPKIQYVLITICTKLCFKYQVWFFNLNKFSQKSISVLTY